tara:strand:+ start:36 stop:260 length:225 start_codon:yes stop_codon:yes gene_type:complete
MLTLEQILSELADEEISLPSKTNKLRIVTGEENSDSGRATVSVFALSPKAPKKGTLIAQGAVWGGNCDLWLKAA